VRYRGLPRFAIPGLLTLPLIVTFFPVPARPIRFSGFTPLTQDRLGWPLVETTTLSDVERAPKLEN
jgi:hypothetical protein